MAATHHELGNLNVILDRNRIQNDDFCEAQMQCLTSLQNGRLLDGTSKRSTATTWTRSLAVIPLIDNGGPSILMAHTVKGHGVSFMADNPAFHGAAPNDEQYAQAMAELGEVVA